MTRVKHDFRTPDRRGFTLIEIMVVVAIIVVLVGLTIAIGSGVRQGAQVRATKLTLQHLQGIMEVYKADMGALPTGYDFSMYYTKKADGSLDTSKVSMYISGKWIPGASMFPQDWSAYSVTYAVGDQVVAYDKLADCYKLYVCLSEYKTDGGDSDATPPVPASPNPSVDTGHWKVCDAVNPVGMERYLLYAFQQYPKTRDQLLKISTCRTRLFEINGVKQTLVFAVDDAFSGVIGYVPSGVSRSPFLVSKGPDGVCSSIEYIPPYTAHSDNQDNIYSYDR